jgi:hypothetical protein
LAKCKLKALKFKESVDLQIVLQDAGESLHIDER